MRFYNSRELENNIHHFQGADEIMVNMMSREYETVKNTELILPEELTIVTTFTDKSKAILVDQLEKWNVPYINSAEHLVGKTNNGEWSMPSKIDLICEALKKVTTKYVLILDAYDVIIYSFDNIIERFLSAKCRVLFNASKNNYPNVTIDKMPFRDYIGEFKHLNAGCVIGYTEDIIRIYDMSQEIKGKVNNIFKSEQYIIRYVFANCSESMMLDGNPIKIDYNCNIFLCCGNTIAQPINKDLEKMKLL